MDISVDEDRSVTRALCDLKSGDAAAAEEIWQKFFHRVCGLARKKLGDAKKRVVDEEDIAQSAMYALYQGIQDERFRQLENRDDLWQLLVMITSRKAANVWRKQVRRNESGESVLASGDDTARFGLQQVMDQAPTDAYVDDLCSTCDGLIGSLEPKLQEVARFKLMGHTNKEIADEIGRSVATVERYLKMIRHQWNQE